MFILSDKSILEKNEKHNIKDLINTLKEYYDFPLYRAPQIFINTLSQGFPVMILLSNFGPGIAGYYTIGKQILDAPVQLLGKAVQDVFYPKLNENAINKKINSINL